MLDELNNLNFDDKLNLINCDNHSLIIGYSIDCFKCKILMDKLNLKNIRYAKVNLVENDDFLQSIAIKLNFSTVNMPMILLFKDKQFVKKLPSSFSFKHILKEINDL